MYNILDEQKSEIERLNGMLDRIERPDRGESVTHASNRPQTLNCFFFILLRQTHDPTKPTFAISCERLTTSARRSISTAHLLTRCARTDNFRSRLHIWRLTRFPNTSTLNSSNNNNNITRNTSAHSHPSTTDTPTKHTCHLSISLRLSPCQSLPSDRHTRNNPLNTCPTHPHTRSCLTPPLLERWTV